MSWTNEQEDSSDWQEATWPLHQRHKQQQQTESAHTCGRKSRSKSSRRSRCERKCVKLIGQQSWPLVGWCNISQTHCLLCQQPSPRACLSLQCIAPCTTVQHSNNHTNQVERELRNEDGLLSCPGNACAAHCSPHPISSQHASPINHHLLQESLNELYATPHILPLRKRSCSSLSASHTSTCAPRVERHQLT